MLFLIVALILIVVFQSILDSIIPRKIQWLIFFAGIFGVIWLMSA